MANVVFGQLRTYLAQVYPVTPMTRRPTREAIIRTYSQFIYLYDGEGISCVFEKTLVLAAQLARMQCQAAGCDQFPLCRHLAPVQRISKQIHFVFFLFLIMVALAWPRLYTRCSREPNDACEPTVPRVPRGWRWCAQFLTPGIKTAVPRFDPHF